MDDKIISECDALINYIANKFYGIDKEDLLQAGRIGLINAYKHYKKNSNTKFSSFAYTYIFGEMYNLSINNCSIKTNRDTLKLIKLIDKAKIYLTQSLGKIPSMRDIASYLEIDENDLNNAYIYKDVIYSLDKNDDNSLYDTVNYIEDNDTSIDIKSSLNELSKDEYDIIMCRYYNDLTQSETAKILGMSQVKVSRCEQKTLKRLKKIMTCE